MTHKHDPNTIRPQDEIRIVNPEFFLRCGYENNHKTAMEKIRAEYGDKILQFIHDWEKSFHGSTSKVTYKGSTYLLKELTPPKSYDKIISALAYDLVGIEMRTGAERKIFTERNETYKGSTYIVDEVFFCQTGKYYPAKSYQEYWSGEYEYTPGGLSEVKTHRILRLKGFSRHCHQIVPAKHDEHSAIEACNVEKVRG